MKVVILAGGSGTRLWPFSRKSFPKQFLQLGSTLSFLQQTAKRALALACAQDIYILTHNEYLDAVTSQLKEVDPEITQNILLEPEPKNTAPALAYAVKELITKGICEEEQLLVLPSDHLVAPIEAFCTEVERASALADRSLVTFGVHPTRPETGYGYLRVEEEKVTFIEKPTLERAQKLLLEGNAYWNSGMFLFSIATFVQELALHAKELAAYVQGEESFSQLAPISFDYAIMEKSEHVTMVPLALTWSDVGSWENVYELSSKDENNNAISGHVIAHKTENCLVYSESRLVATLGLKDLYILETADALLVMDKAYSQEVKELVGRLKEAKLPESFAHKKLYRPWGHYTVLEEGSRYKIKQILVHPGQTLSLQMHYHRSEHWVVVSGTARVTIADEEKTLHEEESIFVPKSSVHRVSNPGKVPLKIIEVQVGEYLGEDDIVRLDDVYGRVPAGQA